MGFNRAGRIVVACVLASTLLSCGKDEQETQKFERADHDTFVRDMSELTSFSLANGITVYIQEERTDNQVAVEFLYRVGYLDEPKGQVQVAHLTEHLVLECGIGSFAAGKSREAITDRRGMINAEVAADLIHIDYIVGNDRFETTLEVEAARMTSLNCTQDVLDREAALVVREMNNTISDPKLAITKFSMMAFNQTYRHGERFVPIRDRAPKLTLEEAHAFHRTHYGPEGVVIVIIGNVKTAEAEALVRKHFESIPRRAAPPHGRPAVTSDTRATWDVDASAIYLVAPGPFGSFRERLTLTIFGAYVHQLMTQSPEIYSQCRGSYATNHSYRVEELPFFIFAQPSESQTVDGVRPLLVSVLEAAIVSLDDSRVESLKANMKAFVQTVGLQRDRPDFPMQHFQVIGQEAVNVGLKHFLREGRSVEEFAAEIDAITPDEMRAVVARHADPARLIAITFEPRS